MLRCHRNHSAFNSHNLPSDLHYYLPALFFACRGQLVAAAGFGTYLVASGCTYGLVTVSFHSISFEVYFAAVSAQGFARPLAGLLATHLAIVFSVYSAYLPGLLAARPSAFVEGGGVEPPAHPRLFDVTAAVVGCRSIFRSVGILFQFCRFAPLFPAFSFLVWWLTHRHPD